MVGQVTYPPAQLTSVTATSTIHSAGSTAENSSSNARSASDANNVATAKTRLLQLQARLRTLATSDLDPKSASAQISRLAQEIDATAKEYAADGGDMPVAGVPARNSPLVAQTLARSDQASEKPKPGSMIDIRV